MLGLLPGTFLRLTPHELMLLARYAGRQKEQQEYQLAWQTAYLLSALSGKTVTPDQLLGKADQAVEDKVVAVLREQYKREGKDPADADKLLASPSRKLEHLMGGEAWPST